MHSQSQHSAYFSLVDKLVEHFRDGDDKVISVLKEHIDFMDVHLLDAMLQVANQKKQQGDRVVAIWLLKFRVKLAQIVGVSDLQPFAEDAEDKSFEEAYNFLIQAFTHISEDPSNPQSARRFLAQHEQDLTEQLSAVFPSAISNMMNGFPVEQRLFRAVIIAIFGSLLRESSGENAAENAVVKEEIAIGAYEQALQFIPYERAPDEWTDFTTQLILLLSLRKRGSRSENMEQAIARGQQALETTDDEISPAQSSRLMTALGIAYIERIEGNRSDNIEQAIAIYRQVTKTVDRKALPEDWGGAMGNLANAYRIRIEGDRASNIEAAIDAYVKALEVISYERMPVHWAQIKTNLALTYSDRIKGNCAANIEAAIALYTQLLKTVTKETMPLQWAAIMTNLGLAYRHRIRGNHADNMEQAISAYRLSLEVNTRQAMPIEWVGTTSDLAAALQNRIRGDRTENIEQAIETYQSVLQVITQAKDPIKWAQLITNLASAYRQRVRFDPSNNTKQAIELYHQALKVLTQFNREREQTLVLGNLAAALVSLKQEDSDSHLEESIAIYEKLLQQEELPSAERSMAMLNLSSAYIDRKRGTPADNVSRAIALNIQALERVSAEEIPILQARGLYDRATAYLRDAGNAHNVDLAIDCCRKALVIADPYQAPADCRKTSRLLGDLYFDTHRWAEAVEAYDIAMEAADILYQSSLLRTNQQAELVMTGDLFHRRAFAQAKIGQLKSAIVTLEQGRTRSLNDSLARDISRLTRLKEIAPAVYSQYQRAIEELRQLEADDRALEFFETRKSQSQLPAELRGRASHVRQTFQNSVAAIRKQPGYESFLALPTWEQIANAVVSEQAVVYVVATSHGGLALVASHIQKLRIDSIWLEALSSSFLHSILFVGEDHSGGWFGAYQQQASNGRYWRQTIEQVTSQLWQAAMAAVVSYLSKLNCAEAVLIPTGYLSFLPLHAAWQAESKGGKCCYALDSIQFRYSPSAQVLQKSKETHLAQQQGSGEILNTWLAINEPARTVGVPLPNSKLEIKSGLNHFRQCYVLEQNDATRTNVLNALPASHVVHFSCHGIADLNHPLRSGLLMADNQMLTLNDLLNLELKNIRLAILSACETGLPGAELPDEAVSLAGGMVTAGAVGVIASLWQVPDVSTMLLISQFYKLWREYDLAPPEALVQAQRWLKQAASDELIAHCVTFIPELSFSTQKMSKAVAKLHTDLRAIDYSEPYHWAAFTYMGI